MADHGDFISRTFSEFQHWFRKDWTFEDVGEHWDLTEDYDETNLQTYSYFRRFKDGLSLSDLHDNGHVLDVCSRTGNGTVFFYEHGKVKSVVCADVSENLGVICRTRIKEANIHDFRWVLLKDYDFPFGSNEFDNVLCFETVEHFSKPELFIKELCRVLKPGGKIIITTPNVLWEPIHALAAILDLHHSEGPHRFIRIKKLLKMIQDSGIKVEKVETTVLIPGGPKVLVRFGEWLEKRTRNSFMPILGLRRIIIGRKM